MPNPQTSFQHTKFDGPSVFASRRQTVARVTLQAQLRQLRDTGRYDCFKLKWHPVYDDKSNWPVPPHLFWDSDLAKWIEGACYLLTESYDAEIDHAIQEMVKDMRAAQRPDGYLNLHYIMVEPDKRWSNLQDMHELYNCGHMIEAALAHYYYYRNKDFLEVMEKYVSLIHKTFGPGEGRQRGYPGHPEIELALLRLYRATGNQEAYELAHFFLHERGNPSGQDGKHYYTWQIEQRNESPYKRANCYPIRRDQSYWYNQSHLPILEQKTVEGHSVRNMYLLTGAADMICLDKEGKQKLERSEEWLKALTTLWDNMVDRKMYVTGGIGAMEQWEGFGLDYFLPQGSDEGGCYAETCASIGVVLLAERLLTLDLNARYADVMELCLYNGIMTAMSLDGKAFTYVNQLASSEGNPSKREEWFDCSCCPPNVTRLYGSLGGYLWHFGGDGPSAFINVHLYTSATLEFQIGGETVSLQQKSNWPWEGKVSFRLRAPEKLSVTLRLRLPGWSDGKFVIKPELPATGTLVIENGYLVLDSSYLKQHPEFDFEILGFRPRFISPHPYTNQSTLTLARGPIVYCAEDVDNAWEKNHFKDVVIKDDDQVWTEQRVDEATGERYVGLQCPCWTRSIEHWTKKAPGREPGMIDTTDKVGSEPRLVLIPYYLRANRGGRGHMRVGLLRG